MYLVMLWPWPLTFWPQNLISSSLSRDAPATKVWRKPVNRYWRYRGNIKLPRESRTYGQRHGRTTRKHIASAGAYWRRRLKNSFMAWHKRPSNLWDTSQETCHVTKFSTREHWIQHVTFTVEINVVACTHRHTHRRTPSDTIPSPPAKRRR